MFKRKENFFRRKFLKKIVSLSSPVVLGMLSQVMMNVIDTAFVGRLGESADEGLAALGLGIIGMWLLGGTLNAISVGIQALSSRRFGEGNFEEAGKVAFNGLILAFALSFLMAIVGFFLSPKISKLLSSDLLVSEYTSHYLSFRFIGLIPFLLMISMKSFYDGIGHTKIYMFTTLFMNFINIFLAYGFILGGFGFPRLEVAGAGLAATLSGMFGMIFILSTAIFPEYRKFKIFRFKNFSPSVLKAVIKVAYPSSIAAFFTSLGFLLFLRIVGIIGTIEQAASTVLINLASLSFLPTLALGTASATLVGQSLGARKHNRGMIYGIQSVKLGGVIMGILGAFAFFLAPHILKIFTDHPDVLSEGTKALRLLSLVQIFQAMGIVFAQSLLGSGDTKFVMLADVILHYLILLPLTYILGVLLKLGIWGAWGAMDIYVIMLAAVMTHRFLSGKWQKIKI